METSAVLLIHCPDQKGLVARVSSLLYELGANILHADQHEDHALGMFFMRIEFALDGRGSNAAGVLELSKGEFARGGFAEEGFTNEGFSKGDLAEENFSEGEFAKGDFVSVERALAELAPTLSMNWSLVSKAARPRVALFCSQYLHCMADLLERWRSGELECEIPLIVSNHRDVEGLAKFYGVRFEHVPVKAATRAEGEARQLELLREANVDLVVLARYMQILTPEFVAKFPARIINVHHSFLPAFVGARPYHAAHARGVKLIGATSHYVTEVLDDGPIIEQDVARISHRDQVEDLVARGRDLERVVLSRAVRWHLERRILSYGNKTVVFD